MSSIDKLASELKTLITESDNRKPTAYDTTAEVVRVEDNVLWVHIPGGVDETPVRKTINAKPGDAIQLRIAGGSAWITGNDTSPPTDDTRANYALDKSIEALDYAAIARAAANIAEEAARSAKSRAEEVDIIAQGAMANANNAATAAEQASLEAINAKNSADIANSSAEQAVYHLSEIEQIIDALDWISSHGEYSRVLDSETEIIKGKWYFKPDLFSIVMVVSNPKEEGLYELVNDEYIFTEDTEPISGKTYYKPDSFVVDTPISNPYIEGFYQLASIDEAVSNYISTHLYLDNTGLHVRMDSSGAKLTLTGTGVYIVDSNGNTVAEYSGSIVLGDSDGAHIEVDPTYGLSFYQTKKQEIDGIPVNRVAYIQEDRLFIESATLTNNLQIGNFRWVVLDHRISLKYNPIS